MNIVEVAAIKLRCGCCEQVYEVPLRDILLSYGIVHFGCPVLHERNAPGLQVRIW